MTVDRLLDIYALMERERSTGSVLCEVAATFMELDGAGIVLIGDNHDLTSLCTSNPTAEALMDLEITLGEGPAFDASLGDANEEADLLRSTASKWTTYRSEATALGARAVFGYPIRFGAARFGALSLYRHDPGPLNSEQSSDAYLMASVIGRAILGQQAGGSRASVVGELDGASNIDFRAHQAAGMLAIQGSMSVKDALVALRAHAFGMGSLISELAERVITGATRFDLASQEWISEPTVGIGER
jgi:hypothetical protein